MTNKKSICFFSGDITRSGGTERVTSHVAGELARREYAVSVISLMESASETFYDFSYKIQRHVILKSHVDPIIRAAAYSHQIIYRLARFIKQYNIDIIIDVDSVLDMFSLPAKLLTSVKVITWEQFNYFAYAEFGNSYRLLIKKMAARFSDYIVVLTDEDKGYHEANLKLKCPVEAIYNPHHQSEYTAYDMMSKTIFSAGRLNFQKGFDMLVDVARIVFAKHKDWRWVIAGEGEERERLEQKITLCGLKDNIKLIGNVKDIEEYYKKSGIFVLTSRFEGFGLVIAEAKRFNLPIVSFECKAGPRELIIDNSNGFLVKCFDIEGMAEKINLLIEDEKLRGKFSGNACDGTDKYSYSAVMEKWEKVIGSLG